LGYDPLHVESIRVDLGSNSESRAMSSGYFNIPTPTFGGRQFWADCQFFRGWRIQKHVYSGHFRLLDPSDIRRAWGSLDECRTALNTEKQARHLPPMSGTAVIALHGILRSSKTWSEMQRALEPAGYTFVNVDYPSSQRSISDFAEQLQELIASLDGIETIHFVAHSMGGLIIRRWCQLHSDPRVQRLVMIGTPNSGAEIATMLKKNLLFQWIYGPAGQQLVSEPEEFISTLPKPTMEFAVIAGSKGTPDGFNPLIPGDDDGVVTVKSARLPGAADSLAVRVLHSFQPWSAEVIEATRLFLQTGALRASGVREPITKDASTA
jgi:pimeloyl-ACP methyl ester carboxylesterase